MSIRREGGKGVLTDRGVATHRQNRKVSTKKVYIDAYKRILTWSWGKTRPLREKVQNEGTRKVRY